MLRPVVSATSIALFAAYPAVSQQIVKNGTVDVGLVETSPVVFQDRLLRFESIRPTYHGNTTGEAYFRFIDWETGNVTPNFAAGHDLGSAFVENGVAYVFGTPGWGASSINMFTSTDLVNWEQSQALSLPGWELFNTSVTQDENGYVMAFEVGAPASVTGVRFTNRFATSTDLQNWTVLPEPAVYSKDKYSAAPTIRWHEGYYYLTYLEERPGFIFETHMTRSTDLIHWEESPNNAVLSHSDEDRVIANATISAIHQQEIANAANRNNSDLDYIEFNGQVFLYYSWGDQAGNEFLAQATFDGDIDAFYEHFFPIPEPSSLALLGVGALTLMTRRRR